MEKNSRQVVSIIMEEDNKTSAINKTQYTYKRYVYFIYVYHQYTTAIILINDYRHMLFHDFVDFSNHRNF